MFSLLFFCIWSCQHAICLFVKYSHVDGSLSPVGLCRQIAAACTAGVNELGQTCSGNSNRKDGWKKRRLYKRHLRGKHLIPLGGAIAGLKQQMKCMQIHWEGKIKTMIIRISPFQTLRSAINRHVKHMLHTHGQVQHKSRKTLQTRHLN